MKLIEAKYGVLASIRYLESRKEPDWTWFIPLFGYFVQFRSYNRKSLVVAVPRVFVAMLPLWLPVALSISQLLQLEISRSSGAILLMFVSSIGMGSVVAMTYAEGRVIKTAELDRTIYKLLGWDAFSGMKNDIMYRLLFFLNFQEASFGIVGLTFLVLSHIR